MGHAGIAIDGIGVEQEDLCEGAKEDKGAGAPFLKHLKGRGLNGVRLIISDACQMRESDRKRKTTSR